MNLSFYKYFIYALICMMFFVVLGFGVTHSYFSDTAVSNANTFSAANVFPTISVSITPTVTPSATPTPTPTGIADHIVISEVQIDGGPGDAEHDFIELYNPTNTPVDINGYRLVSRTGNSSTDDLIKSFTTITTIPAHGYYLWARSTDATFPLSIGADTSTTASLTSSMSIALRNGPNDTGILIDALSWNNGSTFGEGTNANPPGADESLERKAYTTSTSTSMFTGGADETKGNGFDSGNNLTDVVLRSFSQPQNSSSSTETP